MGDPSLLEVVEVERVWLGRRDVGAHDEHVAAVYGISSTRWAQLLNAAIDDPRAMATYPVVCRLLRQRRDAGRKSRR